MPIHIAAAGVLNLFSWLMKISAENLADILGISKRTLLHWERCGRFASKTDKSGRKYFDSDDLMDIPEVSEMVNSRWDTELKTKPKSAYTCIELFAGAGGLALGMEQAGLKHIMLNEQDKYACATLKQNRPLWNVIENDIHKIDFKKYANSVDLLTGGFPCQAFSHAGNRCGFEDARGTLFFELARAIRDAKPKVVLCENVRGLLSHDSGKTFKVIRDIIPELGYTLIEPRILQAVKYKVPQKRERLIIIAIRNDYADKANFRWPEPYYKIMNLRDALYKGDLYETDVPVSKGQKYPEKKQRVMALVPMGGYWKDLPVATQKEYMGKSFYSGGGKTGMARRLSLDEPALTLTCSPSQKETERCHPTETRPLTIREYARIQTFPDTWEFAGAMSAQYKQIGNAVPVNLAYALGRSLIRLLNEID